MELKICSVCKIEKVKSEFSKNLTKLDGLNSDCKDCHREYRKQYYVNNRDKEIENAENNRKKNLIKTECSVCLKPIFRRRRDVSTERFCSTRCKSLFKSKGPINWILNEARKRAKIKKLSFNLTYDFIYDLYFNKQNQRCAVTNVPIIIRDYQNGFGIDTQASLDRIDSKKGYTKDNVRFVVLGINYLKSNRNDDQMFNLLDLICENYKRPSG